MGLVAFAWWQHHGMGSSKISSSHLAFWQLHSRRGQRRSLSHSESLSPLTLSFGLNSFFFTCGLVGWDAGLMVYNFRGAQAFCKVAKSFFFFFFFCKLTYFKKKKKFWARGPGPLPVSSPGPAKPKGKQKQNKINNN